MPKVVREKTMDVSLDALKRVILDFEKYPLFLGEVVVAKTKEAKQAGHQLVEFEIEVIKRFAYTLDFDLAGGDTIRWRLVDSNFFTANEGSWQLKAVGKDKVHATYELEVGVKFMVPGFVAKKLTEVSLPKLLDNFEARASKVSR